MPIFSPDGFCSSTISKIRTRNSVCEKKFHVHIYLKLKVKTVIHFSGKLSTGIDNAINFDLVKSIMKNILIKHKGKIEGGLSSNNTIYQQEVFYGVFMEGDLTQPAFTCLKANMEIPDSCVKYVRFVSILMYSKEEWVLILLGAQHKSVLTASPAYASRLSFRFL